MEFLKNKDGRVSVTRTAFVLGFVTITLKLLASGISVGSLKIESFTGVDYGASLAALGGVYVMNKTKKKDQ